MTNILFPGRHHLLTNFQFTYLYKLLQTGLSEEPDVNGEPIGVEGGIDNIVFAITSANHSNTRRNPLPLYQRAMALQDFSRGLPCRSSIFDIDDVGQLGDFAKYTLKRIKNRSEGQFDLTPDNTVVLCSTPVLEMYESLGFKILPSELVDRKTWACKTELPWEIVEEVANTNGNWRKNAMLLEKAHPASQRVWRDYNVGQKVRVLFNDWMIGADGDLTETRDYNTYVREMDLNADLKFTETSPHIRPGRIGDIGCAVGSWIKRGCQETRLKESDFYGVEVSRKLYDLCGQRKENGEFQNPYVFFMKRNAVLGLVFDPDSMNTIHTSSLTHEIESYGGRADLLKFIENRYAELSSGGVWINRDVVGPENGDEIVYMRLNGCDGANEGYITSSESRSESPDELRAHLEGLSTFSRFIRFAKDFRAHEGYHMEYDVEDISGMSFIRLKLRDACEFMTKKDYTDNWMSEMHETFCHWSLSDWKETMQHAGFRISPESRVYTNQWIVDNRLKGRVDLYRMMDGALEQMEYPTTHMLLLGEKN